MAAFFSKNKQDSTEPFIKGILDSQDADVIVMHEKANRLLFMNKAAKDRLNKMHDDERSHEERYMSLFPGLLNRCPDADAGPEAYPVQYDVKDIEGRIFSVNANRVQWLEDAPAIMLTLRDVTLERQANQKLYSLAYIDHLTGVPNRQKLKEDFDAIAAQIEKDQCCGTIAIFDLDNFKSINDTYGHNTGDVMLRRLTAHLESEPAYKDHLYRLGGDEFVLLYSDPMGRFSSEQELKEHYEKLLSGAFLSYTMPNIELSCTISMGVAFFPKHGESYSELLRKADIALYKAKESGRNRLVFFEDQYDNAKTFKDLYINIQPILTGVGRTYGYEMIDRGNEGDDKEDSLSLSDFDRSLDALGLGDIENDAHYFIGYINQLMSKTVQRGLPKDKFVIQIHIEEEPSAGEMARYKELRAAGYSLCLSGVRADNAKKELLELADYIKFDQNRTGSEDMGRIIKSYPNKKFIALHVDSNEEFATAKVIGFKLFQGFFFEQPVQTQKTKDIDPMKVNYFRLLKLTSTDDYVDFREISSVISSDVALSYKLLRLLNSAAVGLRNQISSIDMAVAYLGEENLKKWIAMLALRGIASDKPLELVRISLIRAQFGELLAQHFTPRRDPRHVFLVGLFSLLHIALEKSKEELLEEIPVAEEIRTSLLTKTGPHSDLLQFFSNYEYANWDEISEFGTKNGLSDRLISDSYIAAVKWYND
ncbi:diguanylate cyclase, partial [Ruminococcaceae bacterium OttesenSCG-928-I18]|nr:diguanylate cyclase [Ruminococcaceae bacterium OttesenSCG-928-I18]